jgi:uncharacterized protein (TIGR03437 family)
MKHSYNDMFYVPVRGFFHTFEGSGAGRINILTPPDAMSGPVQVVVTNSGVASASFTAQAQALSPSFFVFGGGPYVAATHANGSLIGPSTLHPGATVTLYANGFWSDDDACGQRLAGAGRDALASAGG